LAIRAPGATLDTFYVQRLIVNGRPVTRAWLPETFIAVDNATLDFVLAKTPNLQWAIAPADLPPSFPPGK
jgi:putative alpha-1,2-mannosidase